jgi:hypothetical protein
MQSLLIKFFETRAEAALIEVPKAISGMGFYHRLHRRMLNGEDLSGEVPVIAEVGLDAATKVVAEAEQEFKERITSAWQLKDAWAADIATEIEHVQLPLELIPRFNVCYTFATEYGAVVVKVKTTGLNFKVTVDASACGHLANMALQEADQLLTFAALKS